MIGIEPWLDILRREALNVVKHSQTKSTLVCTGYNPNTHAVKGILVPYGVETGWVPIGVIGAGSGYGVLVGPRVGDPQALDGDQFDIEFEFGDPNTPVARHRFHSTPDAPPVVQSGEILMMHQKGHKIYFAHDGSVTIYHAAAGGEIAFDSAGDLMVDAKGKNLTIQSVGGNVSINGIVDING